MVLLRLKFLTFQVLEDTPIEDKKKTLLVNIQQKNWLGKQEKLVARVMYKLQNFTTKFLQSLK